MRRWTGGFVEVDAAIDAACYDFRFEVAAVIYETGGGGVDAAVAVVGARIWSGLRP